MREKRWDAIVVLGARVFRGGAPSDALRYRALTGAQRFLSEGAGCLVFSGGTHDAATPTEARVAMLLALKAGVPAEDCVLEEESRTTWENALRVAPLLRARGASKVLVVTDAYHLFRALRCFWSQGVKAEGAASHREDGSLFVPQRRLTALTREAAALLQRPRLLVSRPP